jgi:NCS1 family nucleobase:cation symporter-1
VISILPVIPGFLVAVGLASGETFPGFLVDLYSYAWFVTFIVSFLIYWAIMAPQQINIEEDAHFN